MSFCRKCALISAHYGLSDVFDNLVISLCKFTTLLNAPEVSVMQHCEYPSLPLKYYIFWLRNLLSRSLQCSGGTFQLGREDVATTAHPSRRGHGFIGYPKGRNVERALGPSCPCVLCISHSLGLYLLHQI